MSRSVLIVGTTPDYVTKLYERYSKSLTFLADQRFQEDPLLAELPPSSLVFAPLEKPEDACRRTHEFLRTKLSLPDGIACFDCDSLLLASRLGSELGLRFPPWEAIARCRSKFETKKDLDRPRGCFTHRHHCFFASGDDRLFHEATAKALFSSP